LLDCEVVGSLILLVLPSRFKLRMCTSAAVTSLNYKIVEMAQREPYRIWWMAEVRILLPRTQPQSGETI
jgi:hypothetical protein